MGGNSTMALAGANGPNFYDELCDGFDRQQFKVLTETMSFREYLELAMQRPQITFSSQQRIYYMILSAGVESFKRFNRTHRRYKFFSEHPEFPIFGLERNLEEFVKQIKGAAGNYGTEKRIILLHGPVGSSKSTLARAIKRGLEMFSQTSAGALYTFEWVKLPTEEDEYGNPALEMRPTAPCPMHDDPIKLVPPEFRAKLQERLNASLDKVQLSTDEATNSELHRILKIKIQGELNPHDMFFYRELLKRYKGDWRKVVEEHIVVRRFVISESERVGIGTFQPKDEKNQDATELTGDVNYMKLGQYGRDSDPRAFNFDGEFQAAHRGMLEMIEMLKLNQQFLYDLLGAAQEKQVKPKKFPQVSIDTTILGHTNDPEYKKLEKNECMEALRDRIVKIDFPYLLRWSDEIKVLQQDYNSRKVRQHIAPHTLETAALFAVLTRLKPAADKKVDLVTKAKLYNGQSMPGYTEETVREMMSAAVGEGLDSGISARFIQNKISNALVGNHDYVNPFMVFHEIKEGLSVHAGADQNLRQQWEECLELAKKELEEILKNEVRRAMVMDDEAIERMFNSYLDNLFAYIEKERVRNEYTGEVEAPNERLMRSIEEKIGIPEPNVDDFRRSVAAYCGKLTRDNNDGDRKLKWDSHAELARALELKLFEDTQDSVKLTSLTKVSAVIDPKEQEKIEAIKARLIKHYGYNERSAADVLHYVGSIFARGDVKNG